MKLHNADHDLNDVLMFNFLSSFQDCDYRVIGPILVLRMLRTDQLV